MPFLLTLGVLTVGFICGYLYADRDQRREQTRHERAIMNALKGNE